MNGRPPQGGGGGGHPGGHPGGHAGAQFRGGGFSNPFHVFEQFFGGAFGGGGGGSVKFGMGGEGMPPRGMGGMGRGPAPPAQDLYGPGSSVAGLSGAAFYKRLGRAHRGSRVWLVQFYSPTCGVRGGLAPSARAAPSSPPLPAGAVPPCGPP